MQLHFLLFIVVLNIVYVFGYFLFAILLNVKEAHYFLGYNPRLFSFRIRNTQFSVGLYIPIVGLASIYTIVDGQKQRAKYPWEFFEHSISRRLIVTLAGAFALFVFGLLAPIIATYVETREVITKEEVNRHGIYPSPLAREWGFQNGDKIIAINGKDYDEFTDLIQPDEILDPGLYYTIERNGKTMDIKPTNLIGKFSRTDPMFISLYAPFEVGRVLKGSPADEAGILSSDRITKVNGRSVVSFIEMREAFENDEDGILSLELQRLEPGGIKTWTIKIKTDSENKIGISVRELIQFTDKQNTLLEAIREGTKQSFGQISATFRAKTGRLDSQRKLSGPVRLSSVGPQFWSYTGVAALWYALWNLFPLPKAAFWEIIALVYERLTGRKYSYSKYERTLNWSWAILIGLMIWTLMSDIQRLLY